MQMQLQHAHESARMCHFADNLKLSVGVGCGPLKLNDLEIGAKFGSPIPVPRNVFLKKVKFRKVHVEREVFGRGEYKMFAFSDGKFAEL